MWRRLLNQIPQFSTKSEAGFLTEKAVLISGPALLYTRGGRPDQEAQQLQLRDTRIEFFEKYWPQTMFLPRVLQKGA